MSETYSTSEAAKLLGISFITLKRWIYAGKIKATEDQRGWWRIEENEIRRIEEEIGKIDELDNEVLSLIITLPLRK